MIMTTGDYLNLYRNTFVPSSRKENRVLAFLRSLFNERVVLFVGYGLDELEVLEYITLKSRSATTAGRPPRHFMLQPFFSHEAQIADFLASYYANECDVALLPFLRDNNDHRQLIEVLEHFARAMPATQPLSIQTRSEMEALLIDE
jgi:hypothetical protein